LLEIEKGIRTKMILLVSGKSPARLLIFRDSLGERQRTEKSNHSAVRQRIAGLDAKDNTRKGFVAFALKRWL
jgi:hypothetical protein